jgi:transposase
VGLDVHKEVTEVCIVDGQGKVQGRERLATTRETLRTFAERKLQSSDHVALEATTNSWAVVRIFEPHVASVTVSNPLATKAIAQAKVKTDKVDATVLAQLLRCGYLPGVWIPDEKTQQLRELTSRRAALVGARTALRNRIHAVLAMRLIVAPKRLFGADGLDWLGQVELDAQGRLLIDSDKRQMDQIDQELARIEAVLAERGWQDERVKLLLTLPGVDVAVAQALLAALGDIDRFADGDHAASYIGLVPSTRQSAKHCYHGPITKQGRSHTRWMMVQAAQHVGKHPGPLGHFFRKLAKKKNRNIAVVATARKLVKIACLMLKENQPYRYAVPRSTETKLARLRVRGGGGRRKTGSAKGTKSQAKLCGGSRTIKSLPDVYRVEGLPQLGQTKPGETRTIRQTGSEILVAKLNQEQVIPRRRGTPPSAPKAVTTNP